MAKYYKSYSLLDAIYDIDKSWKRVSGDVLHKCFEELLPPDKFMEEYNTKHSKHEEWPANSFRGFYPATKRDNEWQRKEAEKEADLVKKVDYLHDMLSKLDVIIIE